MLGTDRKLATAIPPQTHSKPQAPEVLQLLGMHSQSRSSDGCCHIHHAMARDLPSLLLGCKLACAAYLNERVGYPISVEKLTPVQGGNEVVWWFKVSTDRDCKPAAPAAGCIMLSPSALSALPCRTGECAAQVGSA